MTPLILAKGLNISPNKASAWFPYIEETFTKYSIDSPNKQAGFLGQIAVESGSLKWLRELWGPTPIQRTYERNFAAAWPPTPEDQTNRKAFMLGNSEVGDGFRFRGGGLIQTTGRGNFTKLSEALGHDFISHSVDIALPEWASLSAGQYWEDNSLNDIADAQDWQTLTRRINGGLTAYNERLAFIKTFLELLNV
jgi:putative chitinase